MICTVKRWPCSLFLDREFLSATLKDAMKKKMLLRYSKRSRVQNILQDGFFITYFFYSSRNNGSVGGERDGNSLCILQNVQFVGYCRN